MPHIYPVILCPENQSSPRSSKPLAFTVPERQPVFKRRLRTELTGNTQWRGGGAAVTRQQPGSCGLLTCGGLRRSGP